MIEGRNRELTVHEHNAELEERAVKVLRGIIREALSRGMSGSLGIRIPVQRNKLGNIRSIVEQES